MLRSGSHILASMRQILDAPGSTYSIDRKAMAMHCRSLTCRAKEGQYVVGTAQALVEALGLHGIPEALITMTALVQLPAAVEALRAAGAGKAIADHMERDPLCEERTRLGCPLLKLFAEPKIFEYVMGRVVDAFTRRMPHDDIVTLEKIGDLAEDACVGRALVEAGVSDAIIAYMQRPSLGTCAARWGVDALHQLAQDELCRPSLCRSGAREAAKVAVHVFVTEAVGYYGGDDREVLKQLAEALLEMLSDPSLPAGKKRVVAWAAAVLRPPAPQTASTARPLGTAVTMPVGPTGHEASALATASATDGVRCTPAQYSGSGAVAAVQRAEAKADSGSGAGISSAGAPRRSAGSAIATSMIPLRTPSAAVVPAVAAAASGFSAVQAARSSAAGLGSCSGAGSNSAGASSGAVGGACVASRIGCSALPAPAANASSAVAAAAGASSAVQAARSSAAGSDSGAHCRSGVRPAIAELLPAQRSGEPLQVERQVPQVFGCEHRRRAISGAPECKCPD